MSKRDRLPEGRVVVINDQDNYYNDYGYLLLYLESVY